MTAVEASARNRPVDTTRRHVGALDGLRAFAAFLVIVLHVGIYTGQVASSWLGIPEAGPLGPVVSRFTVGVPIFFVLSGLLLYRPYAAAARAGDRMPPVRDYLWHRALRILPSYWLVAVVALALFGAGALTDPGRLASTLLMTHIYQDGIVPTGITQTWSLATEVSFYLVLPLIAAALHRLARPAAVLVALAAAEVVNLVSVVLTHVPAAGAYPRPVLWLPEYAGFFAAGMALSVVAARGVTPAVLRWVVRAPWASWAVAVAAYVLVSTPLTGTTAAYPTVAEALLEHLFYLVIAVALVLPLVFAPGRGPSAVLDRGLPRWLGRVSYGLFLWHMVVVEGWLRLTGDRAGEADVLVLLPVTVLVTVALAAADHYGVEIPLRRFRRVRQ